MRGLLEAARHATDARGLPPGVGLAPRALTREREFVRTNQADSVTEGMELSNSPRCCARAAGGRRALAMVHNLTQVDASASASLPPRLRGARSRRRWRPAHRR